MNVNCVKIERVEESLNITNIRLLIRFNKTREIFPSITQVLSIFLTTAATSASVERVNSKRVNALLPICIHRDIFLDYDKIIDIYASKYPKRMLLINPLSKS